MSTIDYLKKFPLSILNHDVDSNLGKLWQLFSTQMDELLVEVVKAYLLFDINSQAGVNLDQIGKQVVQTRLPAETDTDYRISLFAAIASKISSGSISDILEVIDIIKAGDPSLYAKLIELFPATIQVFTNMSDLLSSDMSILNKTRAAGIGLFLTLCSNNPFTFLNDPDGLGFSDQPPFDSGGEFSEYIS